MHIFILTDYILLQLFLSLVAQWYKPAMSFLGKVHDLSLEYPDVLFAIVDMDESPALVTHLGMMAQPGMRLYERKGEKLQTATDITGITAYNNPAELETIIRFELEKRGARKVAVEANPAAAADAIIQQAIHLSRPGGAPSSSGGSGDAAADVRGALKLRPLASASSSSVPAPAAPSKYKYFPNTAYELFRTVSNLPTIETKIFSFAQNNAPCTLTTEQSASIKNLIALIDSSVDTANGGIFNGGSKFVFEDGQLDTLEAMLVAWPREVRFPILDIFRIVLLHPIGRAHFVGSPIIPQLIKESTAADAPFPFQFMTFKALSNLFDSSVTDQLVIDLFESVLTLCGHLAPSTNKNLQLASTTLLLNYCTFLVHKKYNDSVYNPTPLLDVFTNMLEQSPALSDDSLFRIVIAIGTMHLNSEVVRKRTGSLLALIDRHADSLKAASPAITEHTSTAIRELHELVSSS